MNVCFILVLSIAIQLLFSFLVELLFPQLSGVDWAYYVKIMVQSFLSLYLPAYLYLRDEKKKYFTDCFEGVKPGVLMLACVGIGFCGQYVAILANLPVRMLMSFLGADMTPQAPQIKTFGMFIFAVIDLCLLPAVLEEVLFRGVVFNYFRQFGKKAAVIFSSLLFAMMHFDFNNFFATLLLGLVCGYIICKTNRIVYTMIVHFTLNFVSTLSNYISNFEVMNNFYTDCLPVFFLVSIPLLIYLLLFVKAKAQYLPYHDQENYETVIENVYPVGKGSSIKIIEHDIRENNMGMAFKKIYASLYFYIILILFIYFGGAGLWS